MRRLPYFIFTAIFLVLTLLTGWSKSVKYAAGDERKADYMFLEAMREKALGNNDAAYELLNRARQLSPGDVEIGSELANFLLALSAGDSATVMDAVSMIRDYYSAHPDDYYEALRYGLLNENIGRKDEALKVWSDLHNRYPEKLELTYKYADFLSSLGDTLNRHKAIAIYDSIEVIDGRSIPVSSKKIQIYYALNDTQSIINEARNLVKAFPQSVDNNVFLADIFQMMNNNDSALAYYNRACEIDPSSGVAYYSRASFYDAIGDSAGFDREVFNALVHDDLEVNTKLAIMRSYIEKIYTDSAEQPRIDNLFDVLIEQHPHERDIHDLYARYLIVKKDYDQAAEQTELTLDLDPSDEQGWEMLSSLYFQVENYQKAGEAIDRSIRYFPKNPMSYFRKSVVDSHFENYNDAFEDLNKALEYTDSTDLETMSLIYSAFGDVSYASDQKDQAFEYYNKALAYNPLNYSAMNNCAYFLACEGRDLNRALQMIEKCIEVEPSSTNLDTYAWVLFKLKEYVKAKEVIDSALSTDEEVDEADPSKELLEHAGDIYFMAGYPDEAVEFWQEALALDEDNELLQRKVKNKTYFYK